MPAKKIYNKKNAKEQRRKLEKLKKKFPLLTEKEKEDLKIAQAGIWKIKEKTHIQEYNSAYNLKRNIIEGKKCKKCGRLLWHKNKSGFCVKCQGFRVKC